MTINKLLGYALDTPAKAVKRFMLDRQINAEYANLHYFQQQVKNGHKGVADSSKRIANLEAQRRDV